MSTISIYDVSIGLALNASRTLRDILKKAQSHPDAATFANARLHPDMFALGFQVETVSNFSKKAVERLTGADLGVWEDKDPRSTEDVYKLDELVARLDKTVGVLEGVKKEDVEAAAGKTHTLTFPSLPSMECSTVQYLQGYVMPNLMFHLSTAYGILRAKGVDVGKKDFLTYFMADIFPKEC